MRDYVEACVGVTDRLNVSILSLSDIYEELKRTDDISEYIISQLFKEEEKSSKLEVAGSWEPEYNWLSDTDTVYQRPCGLEEEEDNVRGDESIRDIEETLPADPLEDNLGKLGWEASLQYNEDYRDALRDRAAQLSHGKLSGLKIAELPRDILVYIADHFRSSLISSITNHFYDGNETGRVRDVGSLRAACRAFYQLASPLLCTTLTISIDQISLRNAFGLVRNPLIAQGVRCIKLRLAYRPSGIAKDITRFIAAKIHILEEEFDERYRWETDYCARNRDWDILQSICGAWSRLALGSDHPETPEARDYQRVLLGGFRSYKIRYQANRSLARAGQFSRLVARIASMLQQPIHFVTEHDAVSTHPWQGKMVDAILNEPGLIREFLAQPNDWDLIVKYSRNEIRLPLQIHGELPDMLLSEGAAPARSFKLDYLPLGLWPKSVPEMDGAEDTW